MTYLADVFAPLFCLIVVTFFVLLVKTHIGDVNDEAAWTAQPNIGTFYATIELDAGPFFDSLAKARRDVAALDIEIAEKSKAMRETLAGFPETKRGRR